VENYRPLTISSLICRTYWGIIDKKLREVISFSPRQKGFVHETGCFKNVHILNEIIKAAKVRDGLVVVQLDITKAFDTVPHRAIEAALSYHGVPKFIRDSIMNSYKSLKTIIEHSGSQTEVLLRRGVKQGDPLSPFIFNAIMDPLLEQLEEMKGYKIDDRRSISALAFADDLILIATTKEKAQDLLHHTETYLNKLGMCIAAEKCASFQINRTKDAWYIANPDLQLVRGDKIPSSTADSSLCYLGGNISPWYGLHHNELVDQLLATLDGCRKAQLKPHQKLLLTCTHILPHFLHKSVLATPPMTTIRAMDQAIRNHIKSILHLPMCTPNGLLYCSKRDGGLGVPKLEVLASTTALKQGITLLNTLDPTILALLHETKLEQRLQGIARAIRLTWPVLNFKSIDAYKKRQKVDEINKWAQLKSKGKAVTSFKDDRIGNAWLYKPSLLKPSRFVTALRMRSATTSDKVTMSKVVPQTNLKCRKCKLCNETLAHILGQCIYTKTQRIRRHDEIRDFVSKRMANLKEKSQIIEEALIPTPTGNNLKPDLVVVNRGRVHVVDVTVRHEDAGYLEEGYRSKVEKYTPLLESLASQLRVEKGLILPIVVGTRGGMPKSTVDSLREIGITDRGSYITISLLAIRHSIEIYHTFMDYNALDA
jgi:predicted transcriptional regulator